METTEQMFECAHAARGERRRSIIHSLSQRPPDEVERAARVGFECWGNQDRIALLEEIQAERLPFTPFSPFDKPGDEAVNKTLDELRKTPTHVVCEHGRSQRSCDACECFALEDENEDLRARVKELEQTIGLGKQPSDIQKREALHAADECYELRQLLGSAIMRLEELGETSFKLNKLTELETERDLLREQLDRNETK